MANITPIKPEVDEISLLTQTIDSFNNAAGSIARQYRSLESRVKELDVELKEQNDFLNNILESIKTGIIVLDHNGYITTLNYAAGKITGFASEEVKGEKFDILFDSGFIRGIDLDQNTLNALTETLEIETEFKKNNKEIVNISLSIAPVLQPGNRPAGIVMTMQDITGMKRLEREASRTDRLQAMGEMAVKIAHEVRNPLGSIKLFADILNKELQALPELKALPDYILSGVQSIDSIISNLLLFVKPQQSPDFKRIDMHDVLNGSLFFSGHLIKHDDSIKIETEYYNAPVMVRGDAELLKQVALNLILNAIQAMPDGGKLRIATGIIKNSRTRDAIAEIKFTDTGTGISRDIMTKIFDPFFTTKKDGTGLGLAIVHNILKAHDAGIDVSSSGKGTECTIRIPLDTK